MSIAAVVFDFDGLILDTETADFAAWSKVFQAHSAIFPKDWWLSIVGRGVAEVESTPILQLETQLGEPVDRPAIERHHAQVFADLLAQERPMPGVVSTLDRCAKFGFPCAVASSSAHTWVDPFLSDLGLAPRFSAILCSDDVARAKPYPDLYLAACKRLGVDPANALALEDSRNGVEAAKAAGLKCVAVPNSVTRHMDLSRADMVVDSLATYELEQLIAELKSR